MAKSAIGIKLDRKVLDRLERETPGVVDRVLGKLAGDVEGYAKNNMSRTAPLPSKPGDPPAVQTGNLKNSIIHQREAARSWSVSVNAEYGTPLEYGTVHIAARPFLRPAMVAIAKDAPKVLKAEVFD
jgi:hypothetical protein